MVEILYWINALLLSLKKTNKPLLLSAFILMVLLFCFNLDNADRAIHERRMYDYESMTSMTEYGYYYLMYVFNKFHFDIQLQYIIVGFVYLYSLFYITKRISVNPGLPIAFYMTAIFFLDVVQLRNTTSLIFIYWGLYFLFTIEEKKRSILYFLSFVILASCFHSSNLFFVIFALAKESRNRVVAYTVSLIVLLSSLQLVLIKYFGELYSMGQKIESITSSDRYIGNDMNITVVVFLLILVFTYIFNYFSIGKDNLNNQYSELGLNIAILLTTIIPLIYYSADFRRIYYAVSIILIAIMSNWMNSQKNKYIYVTVALLAFIYLYRFILFHNKNVVYDMIMQYNMLF